MATSARDELNCSELETIKRKGKEKLVEFPAGLDVYPKDAKLRTQRKVAGVIFICGYDSLRRVEKHYTGALFSKQLI